MPEEYVQQCAAGLFSTIDVIMRSARPDHKNGGPQGLSVHQFRALMTIHHHDGASISQIAEHLGASISSASKTVNALVERGLINRTTDSNDRRKLALALTEDGETLMAEARRRILANLAERLSPLSRNECAIVNLAMDTVRSAVMLSRAKEADVPGIAHVRRDQEANSRAL